MKEAWDKELEMVQRINNARDEEGGENIIRYHWHCIGEFVLHKTNAVAVGDRTGKPTTCNAVACSA